MVRLITPDDAPPDEGVQSFHTQRSPEQALEAAEEYLEGAGILAASLQGRFVRAGDELVVHHGRITTTISARADARGSAVKLVRQGKAPLEETRGWVFGLGLAGFVLAWGLAWYNARANDALSPLVTITLYFLGLVAVIVGLYVFDRSLERRGASLMRSLEDAMQGDPLLVLKREVDGLERSSGIANAVLFYCASIILEFLVFVLILADDGIRAGIDEAVTLDVMKAVAAIPIVPAILFGLVWYFVSGRIHRERFQVLRERYAGRSDPLAPE